MCPHKPRKSDRTNFVLFVYGFMSFALNVFRTYQSKGDDHVNIVTNLIPSVFLPLFVKCIHLF